MTTRATDGLTCPLKHGARDFNGQNRIVTFRFAYDSLNRCVPPSLVSKLIAWCITYTFRTSHCLAVVYDSIRNAYTKCHREAKAVTKYLLAIRYGYRRTPVVGVRAKGLMLRHLLLIERLRSMVFN
ncbi:hypothetical protein EVAR_64571_1 [Eumeta japonica]|uniref:Uncharacterized protein n=1 Tax=Eumeta variegata TaxID=151549 RepID=A0A4C1ZCW5_EUMVA|nr:hypothetical protein EVAR_64571_1 [Eumeta japonica]